MLCDSKTSYVCRLQVYTGRHEGQEREQNQGERVVLNLTRDMVGSGRNITTDNFFTSLRLAQKLSEIQMTLLGTMQKNRKELPTQLVTATGREALSSIFAFRDDATLVSYCPKKGKIVVLLSSMHSQAEINNNIPSKKPKIIMDYNSSKGGVDTADQMLRMYTTKRMTRRWPMAIFYNMADISALNGFIIWIALNPEWQAQAKHRRRVFLLQLGRELIGYSDDDAGEPPIQISAPALPKKRARCSVCPREDDKKSNIICAGCGRNVCKAHAEYICTNCKQWL